MDGVLANFRVGCCKLFNTELTEEMRKTWDFDEIMSIPLSRFWKTIAKCDNFWLDLPIFPWARSLVKMAEHYTDDILICSKSPSDANCYSQKRKWLDKHKFGKYEHFIGNGNKGWLARRDRVLIDDYINNTRDFISMGGVAVLFPMDYSLKYLDLKEEIEDKVAYTEKVLKVALRNMED